MLLRRVFKRQTFHHANAALAKSIRAVDRQACEFGEWLRGIHRAREVARIDCSYCLRFERACSCLRLVATARRQRRRRVSAKTAFGVSSRLTVTDQEDVSSKGHAYFYYRLLSRDSFGFQLLSLIVRDQRIDERVEVALHHEIELVNGQTNAVITDAVLFEVVSANLLGAIAGADHRTTFARLRCMLFLFFELLQTRTQHAHRFFAILDLPLLVLHRHDDSGRNVRETHGRVSSVD